MFIVRPCDERPVRMLTLTVPASRAGWSSHVPVKSCEPVAACEIDAVARQSRRRGTGAAIGSIGTTAARRAAIGRSTAIDATIATARPPRWSTARLRAASRTASSRCSSWRARAMPSAVAGAGTAPSERARSRRWPAYSRGPAPAASTRSSHASSRSVRNRRAAHQTPGCGQYSAHAREVSFCTKQSRRATCASSCSSTARRRSSVHASADAGRTRVGRRVPYVIGITSPALCSSRTGRPTCDCRAASAKRRSHAGSLDVARGARQAPQHERFPAEPHQENQHAAAYNAERPASAIVSAATGASLRSAAAASRSRPPGTMSASSRRTARGARWRLGAGVPGGCHRCARDGNAHRPVRQRVGRDRQRQQRSHGERPDEAIARPPIRAGAERDPRGRPPPAAPTPSRRRR